jgi:hypothetical protein
VDAAAQSDCSKFSVSGVKRDWFEESARPSMLRRGKVSWTSKKETDHAIIDVTLYTIVWDKGVFFNVYR